jgi:putative addiction module component (TIGR02574 family)
MAILDFCSPQDRIIAKFVRRFVMTSASKSLLKKALQLDIDERTVLGHQILMSVEDECDDLEVTDELKAKLDRRLEEHLKNPTSGYTREEFKRKLKKLARKSTPR